jgi:hypothetical protein
VEGVRAETEVRAATDGDDEEAMLDGGKGGGERG